VKYSGTVKNGVVVLEGAPALADGTRVEVEPVATASSRSTLGRRLRAFSGAAKKLPPDMARNHDHYLHGRPKK